MSLLISGATIIDAVTDRPIEGKSLWIEDGKIRQIATAEQVQVPPSTERIDAEGKFLIPGLMNANVHLFGLQNLEILARYSERYEELIAEAAQVALKSGLTTVFDTWGPRRFLMAVRDRIDAGKIPGSRIFCGGNIIGFDGPLSVDFFPKASEVASATFVTQVNAIWVENVGRHLMWLPPDKVAKEVRAYIEKGIDFVKFASNDHYPGSFLVFSPKVQEAIVEEAHRAGITAQAHTMTVEGLRIAVESGCDLIQHANMTGPTPIPDATLELMARRRTGAVVFPWTRKGLEWIMSNVADEQERYWWEGSDHNARNLIQRGAALLLANDGMILAQGMATDPRWGKGSVAAPTDVGLMSLGEGHFLWLKAMEEKGCSPMEMLRAATRNIAIAYGKERDLGTLEIGKTADIIILDRNPLHAADNYRSIHKVIKAGRVVDRDALPLKPILTLPPEPPVDEEACYISYLSAAGGKFPMCPCMGH